MTQTSNQPSKPQANSKAAAAGTTATASPTAKAPAANRPETPPLPKTWTDIKPGNLVIAHENHIEGWWEAIVVEVAGDKLTLRWRDYPKTPPIVRTATEVALLYPGS